MANPTRGMGKRTPLSNYSVPIKSSEVSFDPFSFATTRNSATQHKSFSLSRATLALAVVSPSRVAILLSMGHRVSPFCRRFLAPPAPWASDRSSSGRGLILGPVCGCSHPAERAGSCDRPGAAPSPVSRSVHFLPVRVVCRPCPLRRGEPESFGGRAGGEPRYPAMSGRPKTLGS